MRTIRLSFSGYHDVYIRKASEDASAVEIQGQFGGIIVERPVLKLTFRGVFLIDQSPWYSDSTTKVFTDRSSGFEKNFYTIAKYRG